MMGNRQPTRSEMVHMIGRLMVSVNAAQRTIEGLTAEVYTLKQQVKALEETQLKILDSR